MYRNKIFERYYLFLDDDVNREEVSSDHDQLPEQLLKEFESENEWQLEYDSIYNSYTLES
ncbi:MAG: hypothetical protein HXY49_05255 [Ignavibacteriaceae bacterium]|nr:hypothetical protein [Ignavibacteriaceae bacterium]